MSAEVSIWQVLWTGVLSLCTAVLGILAAMFRWNWVRMQDQVDAKADIDAVASRHLENLAQFKELSGQLELMSDSLHRIALDLAVLTERVGHRDPRDARGPNDPRDERGRS